MTLENFPLTFSFTKFLQVNFQIMICIINSFDTPVSDNLNANSPPQATMGTFQFLETFGDFPHHGRTYRNHQNARRTTVSEVCTTSCRRAEVKIIISIVSEYV